MAQEDRPCRMNRSHVYFQSVFCLHTIYFCLQREFEPKGVFQERAKPKAAATQGNYAPVPFMD